MDYPKPHGNHITSDYPEDDYIKQDILEDDCIKQDILEDYCIKQDILEDDCIKQDILEDDFILPDDSQDSDYPQDLPFKEVNDSQNSGKEDIPGSKSGCKGERDLCVFCNKTFAKRALKEHIYKMHGVNLIRGTMLCLDCDQKFSQRFKLIKHLQDEHKKTIETEVLLFKCHKEFENWLAEEEKNTTSMFVKQWGEKKIRNGSTVTLICCRDGQANTIKTRKRSLKSQNSRKTGNTCTSHMVIYKIIHPEPKVIVKYVKTHYGHEKEIQHLNIFKQDKKNIVNQLVLGVSADDIICNAIGSSENASPSRLDILTKKDIANIKKQFGISISGEKQVNSGKIKSLDLWVTKQMRKLDPCVRYYKKFGAEDEGFGFSKEDLCLVIITRDQIEAIKKYGDSVICVDSSYGFMCDDHSIRLTAIIVIDEYGEGIPVTFMYSKKPNDLAYKKMYLCLKDVYGFEVKCNYFMSDVDDALYDGWKEVMGEAGCRLLCSWHVLQAWNRNCYKVKGNNEEDRKQNIKMLRAKLKLLLCEQDLDTFEKEYLDFENNLTKPAFKLFLKYWEETYSHKISEWANCFRQNFPMTNDLQLESMNQIVKYFHSDGHVFTCLDESITRLLDYFRQCFVNKERFILNQRPWNNVSESICQAHEKSLLPGLELLENINEDYLVMNEKSGGIYLVRQLKKQICCDPIAHCSVCKICCHSFSCSCKHYFLNEAAICKHIHFVAKTACKEEKCSSVDIVAAEITEAEISLKGICERTKRYTRKEKFVKLFNNLVSKFEFLPEGIQMQVLRILTKANNLNNSRRTNRDIGISVQRGCSRKRKRVKLENFRSTTKRIQQGKRRKKIEGNFKPTEPVFKSEVNKYNPLMGCLIDHEETVNS